MSVLTCTGWRRAVTPISFTGLALVAAVAFLVPLGLGFFPRLRLPSVVLEIMGGIIIGPSVLGWVRVDAPIQILSILGLAALLFLAGLEIEFHRLKGRPLRLAVVGFLISLGLAAVVSYGLHEARLVETPLFVGIVLSATALGLIVPLLKDSGEIATDFGQLVVAAASISDFATVILLSLFFSRESAGTVSQLFLLTAFLALAAVVVAVIARGGRSTGLSAVLFRLQDTTAQIRIRGASLLLVALVAVAARFGLETILGAFVAGSILALVDRDAEETHPQFRMKVEAIGFGMFVPIFFVTTGVRFNLHSLLQSTSGLVQVPVYLVALLLVRGLPAWTYRRFLGTRRAIAAGLFQATSLSFIVASAQIGTELGVISDATSAALVAAALLSVLIFPLAAGMVLRGGEPGAER
jgi:Kef-type K+ transport system membrane component KefB